MPPIRSLVLRIAVGLCVAFTVAAVCAQAGPQTAPSTSQISGRVVDADGAAVADVAVFVRPVTSTPGPPRPNSPGQPVALRTDADGRFTFTGLPLGQYNVSIVKAGWLAGAYGKRRPAGDGASFELTSTPRTDINITIWRPGVISGTVLDDNGDPLVGVEVRAIRQTIIAGRRQSTTPIRQKTDDRGVYRFSDLLPGDYLIAVLESIISEPPSFTGAIRAAGETPRTWFQTMTAVGTAPIVFSRAAVVTATHRPLVGSLGHLPGMPDGEGVWATYPTTFHPNALTQTNAAMVRVRTGEVLDSIDVNVRLLPTFQVSGVLNDVDGPAAWHAVHLIPADSGETPLVDAGTAVTDNVGAFTFFGVPQGEYIVRVVRTPYPVGEGIRLGVAGGTGAIPYIATIMGGPGGTPQVPEEPLMHASVPVTVGDRHVRGLQLQMQAGPRVRGRVVFEGESAAPTPAQLAQMRIYAWPASGRMDNATMPGGATPTGEFTTSSLWPGRYVMRATPPPGWYFKEATWQGRNVSDLAFDVTEDISTVVVTFTDTSPRLTGTVQAGTGDDLARAMVIVFPEEPAARVDYGQQGRRVVSAAVSTGGAFSMPAPPTGAYFIIALSGDSVDEWQDPAFLKSISAQAERLTIRGDAPPPQSLRLRRVQ